MNRHTILAVIHRQLRESLAETGEVRPLREIVGSVSEEIRSARNGAVVTEVIPIETVAAFVDGDLPADESDAVCQAVMVDNGVLAEMVSAVRAISQPTKELPPLPESLTAQLLSMRASLPRADNLPEATSDDGEPSQVIDEPDSVATVATPTIKTNRVSRPKKHRKPRRNSHLPMVVAALSVAATIAAVVFLATRDNRRDPEQPNIAENKPPSDVTPPPLVPGPKTDAEIRVVEDQNDLPSLDPKMSPQDDPSPTVVRDDTSPPVIPDRPFVEPIVPKPKTEVRPAPTLVKATKLSGARWTDVTGILSRQNQVNISSQARATTWEPIQADTRGELSPSGSRGTTILRTLPLSRAEASFDSGGRIVMSSDTSIQVGKGDESTSAAIAIQHGHVALMDLPANTHIRLLAAGKHLASLHWQTKASAVMQHGASGLEVHVRGGTIDINDQPKKNASIAIARDHTIQSIPSPARVPTWVDRPVETINVKQTFLAQIRESSNVMTTVNQQIRNITQAQRLTDADARSLATLTRWQAALAGERIFRLANSPIPAVRLAALERVATLPRWDPRYARTWAMIENSVRDSQRAKRFKRWCAMLQQQNAPTAAQINALLEDLTANDIGSRAMSDYMLRRFNTNQRQRLPNFDATWTGQTQLRGVNLWRKHYGRNAIQGQRNLQPAAADRLQQR